MQYRREVDGLRTVAVLPVILGHAGFSFFEGGFVGVDVFFVISGYLITTLIINELDLGSFSIARFYERRARRILPALFVVMAATVPFACLWIMPDELKNYGQSLVATALFSNNILLAVTSDYWSMESAFKPFLHTWSLGIEEQYYMVFPLILMAAWKYSRQHALGIMVLLLVSSLALATWGVSKYPDWSFYLLPTRGWELLAGAITAYWLNYRAFPRPKTALDEAASIAGMVMITAAVAGFDGSFLSPGPWILVPVVGAVLIIAFAVPGTVVQGLLAGRVMVGIGLISYSLYLWHQPLFALARAHERNPVGPQVYVLLIALTFVLAYLTWRYVEAPFRNRSNIGQRGIMVFSLAGSLFAIGLGLYLDRSYGMYWRVYDRSDSIAEFDKRIYNSRVFQFKKDRFANDQRLKVFVAGNSFGRDFINMNIETFDMRGLDFAYSDTTDSCIDRNTDPAVQSLIQSADILVFASGYDDAEHITDRCVARTLAWGRQHGKQVFFVGTKNFGYNLNWIIQLPAAERANRYNRLPDLARVAQQVEETLVPPTNFISLLSPVVRDGMVPITDADGKLISTDRVHVTRFGAIYFGERALRPSRYGAIIERRRIE